MIVGEMVQSEYASYLGLDDLLVTQQPRSDEHDEMLFIVAHQIHELWFKQLLHELAELQLLLADAAGRNVLPSFNRVLRIMGVLTTPVDVLDTLTATQFQRFRGSLRNGSGFQSAQFREIEVVLGRRERRVVEQFEPGGVERERLELAFHRPSLFDSFVQYLHARRFTVPTAALHRDVTVPLEPCADLQHLLLQIYQEDEAVALVCDQLLALDQAVQDWRYRHVSMVARIIGAKPGTGGSSGTDYLRSTLFTPLFPDIWAVRNLL